MKHNAVVSLPTRFGRYAVRRRIGSGGFATVWLAYDEQLDAPVAVKVLADNWTEDHHVRTRFVEEGRYLRRVESAHVVSVYDAGELDDGRPYLVMTYADQGTLADQMEVSGISVPHAAEVVRQIGAGLQALHDRGILHRDVKPANVLFRTVEGREGHGPEVRAMVGDLGLGKALDMSSQLTMIAGTPSFVAPEQAQGEPLDPRADQYSLGVLAYLLLAGRTPWSHANLGAAADPGPPPPVSSSDRVFPDAVEDVVRRALARQPQDRWPDVAAFAEAFTAALGRWGGESDGERRLWQPHESERTHPGSRPSPAPATPADGTDAGPARSPRGVLVAVSLAALVVGAVVGWVGFDRAAGEVTVGDDSGRLQVTVPEEWNRSVAPAAWTPPEQASSLPSLSVGSAEDWEESTSGEGVFVGLLSGDELPGRLPGHPRCDEPGAAADAEVGGAVARTSYDAGCPGVIAERLVLVSNDQVLWVQVRSADRQTAEDVLASVEVTS